MTYNEKKSLYENIMKDVAKIVKRQINENSIQNERSKIVLYDIDQLIYKIKLRDWINWITIKADRNRTWIYLYERCDSQDIFSNEKDLSKFLLNHLNNDIELRCTSTPNGVTHEFQIDGLNLYFEIEVFYGEDV